MIIGRDALETPSLFIHGNRGAKWECLGARQKVQCFSAHPGPEEFQVSSILPRLKNEQINTTYPLTRSFTGRVAETSCKLNWNSPLCEGFGYKFSTQTKTRASYLAEVDLSVDAAEPIYCDHGEDAFAGERARKRSNIRKLVIVHVSSLIRRGLVSTIIESSELSGYSVSDFTTIAEADAELAAVGSKDVILLDSTSWIDFNRPPNAQAFKRAKSNGVLFVLLLPSEQVKLDQLQSSGCISLISLEADCSEVIARVGSVVKRNHNGIKRYRKGSKPQGFAPLTFQEFCVLSLIADGLSNKQIGLQVGIAGSTVKAYVTELLRKLGCDRRTKLAVLFGRCLYG